MTSLFLVLYSELYLFSSNHPLYFWHKPNWGMMHYPFCVLLVTTEFLHPCSKECNTVVNFSCKDLSFVIRKADITYCQKNLHHHMTWEVFPLLQFSRKKKKLQRYHVCVHALSHVQLFVAPLAVTHQTPLSKGSPSKNLEWVSLSFTRGPHYQTCVSCIGKWILTTESPEKFYYFINSI